MNKDFLEIGCSGGLFTAITSHENPKSCQQNTLMLTLHPISRKTKKDGSNNNREEYMGAVASGDAGAHSEGGNALAQVSGQEIVKVDRQ